MTSPLHMPKRRTDHSATVRIPVPATAPVAVSATVNMFADIVVNDLPLCMQPGWDPMTPGRDAQARFLDACIAEGVDAREVDPEGYWSDPF